MAVSTSFRTRPRVEDPRDDTQVPGIAPIKGIADYRNVILKAERVSRPAILRLFRFENREVESDAFGLPIFAFISRHVQNFIWTKQRFFAKLKRGQGLTGVADGNAALNETEPRIFLDMTGTSRFYSFGGIARVANKISDEAIGSGVAIPVFIEDGQVFTAKRQDKIPVSFRPGDVYVILDTFWYPINEYKVLAMRLKASGVFVATFIYDVIPAEYPEFMGSAFPGYFTRSLFEIVARSDLLLSVSKSAVLEIKGFLERHAPELATKPIEVIHLGSDSVIGTPGNVRHAFAASFEGAKVFLTVGTICPHKGQLVALAAFDHLWAEDRDVRLVFIGKAEPAFKGIARAIRQHAQFGRKLHWFDDASDAELAFAYSKANCLIQPSIAEGFGVPIIEAQTAGLPVVASDIPVFREIGGANTTYFDLCDSQHLAALIDASTSLPRSMPRMSTDTWQNALDEVVAVVRDRSP